MLSKLSAIVDTSSPFSTQQTTPSRRSQGSSTLSSSLLSGSLSTSSALRRSALYGSEDHIVLDIGASYIKIGFSGEARPRHLLPVYMPTENSVHEHLSYGCLDVCVEPTQLGELYSLDISTCDMQIFERRLIDIMNDIFFKHLLTDPKQRKIIMCENPLTPTVFKQALAQVLFRNLQVPSISFLPIHLLGLMTTGKSSGLVVDCGHSETTVLPICFGRPLYPFVTSTPNAGKILSISLKRLLMKHAKLAIPSHYRLPALLDLPEDLLSPDLVEDLKIRVCFIEPNRGYYSRTANIWSPVRIEDMEDVWTREEVKTSTTDLKVPISVPLSMLPANIQTAIRLASAPISPRNTSSSAVAALIPSLVRCTMIIPGWIRSRLAEILFEGDDDCASVVQVALDCLMKLPRDVRKSVVSGVLLMGGTSSMVGFKERWSLEYRRTLAGKRFRTHRAIHRKRPLIANLYAYELGSLLKVSHFADEPLESKSLSAVPPKPPSHARIRSTDSKLAVAPSFESQLLETQEKDSVTEEQNAGGMEEEEETSPSFTPLYSPQLLGWIGGSLVGSIRGASAAVQVTRERYLGSASIGDRGASGSAASAAVAAAAAAAIAGSSETASGPHNTIPAPIHGLPDWTAIGGWST